MDKREGGEGGKERDEKRKVRERGARERRWVRGQRDRGTEEGREGGREGGRERERERK